YCCVVEPWLLRRAARSGDASAELGRERSDLPVCATPIEILCVRGVLRGGFALLVRLKPSTALRDKGCHEVADRQAGGESGRLDARRLDDKWVRAVATDHEVGERFRRRTQLRPNAGATQSQIVERDAP